MSGSAAVRPNSALAGGGNEDEGYDTTQDGDEEGGFVNIGPQLVTQSSTQYRIAQPPQPPLSGARPILFGQPGAVRRDVSHNSLDWTQISPTQPNNPPSISGGRGGRRPLPLRSAQQEQSFPPPPSTEDGDANGADDDDSDAFRPRSPSSPRRASVSTPPLNLGRGVGLIIRGGRPAQPFRGPSPGLPPGPGGPGSGDPQSRGPGPAPALPLGPAASLRPPPRRAWEVSLDEKFKSVDKPKRFFAVGRIFKTVWFEPLGRTADTAALARGSEYAEECPPFYSEKPYAKFRWFVVVRKRLHHSLCFSITTFSGRGATKTSRGRPRDFVILYKAGEEPPEPQEDEGIERGAVALIIEDDEQEISKKARLDCGRLYTVEDNLRVMKIGRVHPEAIPRLEEFYREAVQ